MKPIDTLIPASVLVFFATTARPDEPPRFYKNTYPEHPLKSRTEAEVVLSLVNRGVEFRVCAATLGARKVAKEGLIDAVSIVPSGISEIARLQLKEGYVYLKP